MTSVRSFVDPVFPVSPGNASSRRPLCGATARPAVARRAPCLTMPTKNSAATMPNSATNAGSSTDCANATENGSRRKLGQLQRHLPRRRAARRASLR